MRKFTFFVALMAILVTTAHAQGTLNETAVFDFTNNVWEIPGYDMVNFRGVKTKGAYTDGEKSITIDPTANKGEYYYENGYLRIAKPGSKIILPAFGFAVDKIEVIGGSRDVPQMTNSEIEGLIADNESVATAIPAIPQAIVLKISVS